MRAYESWKKVEEGATFMPQPDPAVRLATREAAARPQREWGGGKERSRTQSERLRDRGAEGEAERGRRSERAVSQRPKALGPTPPPRSAAWRRPRVFLPFKSRSLQLEPRASPLARKHSPSGVTTLPALPRAPSGGGAEARKAT